MTRSATLNATAGGATGPDQNVPANVIRLADPGRLRTLHVVMIFLVIAIVAASCLLLSAAESTRLVDGAVEWRANSPLRAVVQVLCLNYDFPTFNPGDIKNYVLGIGAGLALLVLTVAALSRTQGGDESTQSPNGVKLRGFDSRYRPLIASQVLIAAYILWSIASSRWSTAPAISTGGSVLLCLQFLWAYGLAHGLSPTAARICTRGIVAVLAVASIAAVWYYYGRNPVLAAKFPFGNPSFLAASLIPGIILAFAWLIGLLLGKTAGKAGSSRATHGQDQSSRNDWSRSTVTTGSEGRTDSNAYLSPTARRVLVALFAAAAISICVWAFVLTQSRGPAVGLLFGLLAAWFFAARGKWRVVPGIIAIMAVVAGAWYFAQQIDAASPTGRSATIRFRLHAWDYAWQKFQNRPIAGHGYGGYTLGADALAVEDVLNDPLAFVSRVEHAHNEWLEVLSDLGIIGFLLIASALVAALIAGARAIQRAGRSADRWTLAALLGALVGFSVEECFGVGLRVTGVPTMFFTVLGLIWAMSGPSELSLLRYASGTPNRRIATGVLGGIFGLAALAVAQQDFSAARDAHLAFELAQRGEDERAVQHAASSVFRLNPQRVLENTSRLVEINLQAAERLAHRAADRVRRAREVQPPDGRLEFLAVQDLEAAGQHSRAATQALKQLVSASPGFIRSGVLEARSNLLQARMAELQGDVAARDAFLNNAAAAIEREMRRQPFNPLLAAEFVRLARPELTTDQVFNRLARPLRHNRVPEAYIAILSLAIEGPDFLDELHLIESKSMASISRSPTESAEPSSEPWAPEKLRLAAAVRFLTGTLSEGVPNLTAACSVYAPAPGEAESGGAITPWTAPIGAASCYAELADLSFFSNPISTDRALAHARHAIKLAPESEQGRELRASIEQRMIHYHLARGEEAEAQALLLKSAPSGVSDEIVAKELGVRLRRLCESILRQRHDWLRSGDGAETLSLMSKWLARARILNQDDVANEVAAAELAVLQGQADAFVTHLSAALRKGFPLQAAKALLDIAEEGGVRNSAIEILRTSVTKSLGETPENRGNAAATPDLINP